MQIFISHSHKDGRFVERLAHDLEQNNIDVWYSDWAMKPGDTLAAKISEGITSSGFMIVVLSKQSVSSRWVEKELSMGISDQLASKGVTIIPVLMETCEFPPTFHMLGDTIYADFRQDYDTAFKKLLGALGARPPRRGIKLYTGNVDDLSVTDPGALRIARWEGLSMSWEFNRFANVLVLKATQDQRTTTPLEIPLSKTEAKRIRGFRESGGWGYYHLTPPVEKYAACVNVTFVSRTGQPDQMVWFIDERRQSVLQQCLEMAVGEPLFDSSDDKDTD